MAKKTTKKTAKKAVDETKDLVLAELNLLSEVKLNTQMLYDLLKGVDPIYVLKPQTYNVALDTILNKVSGRIAQLEQENNIE